MRPDALHGCQESLRAGKKGAHVSCALAKGLRTMRALVLGSRRAANTPPFFKKFAFRPPTPYGLLLFTPAVDV